MKIKFIILFFILTITMNFGVVFAATTAPTMSELEEIADEDIRQQSGGCADGKFCLNVPIPGTSGKMEISSALGNYIKAWYSFIIGGIGIIATVMIMVAGFKWLTSGGNSSKTGDAKDMIVSAIIGLVLAFLSYTVLYLINPNLTIIHLPDLKSKSVDIATHSDPSTSDPGNDGLLYETPDGNLQGTIYGDEESSRQTCEASCQQNGQEMRSFTGSGNSWNCVCGNPIVLEVPSDDPFVNALDYLNDVDGITVGIYDENVIITLTGNYVRSNLEAATTLQQDLMATYPEAIESTYNDNYYISFPRPTN